jgi:predicted esterase
MRVVAIETQTHGRVLVREPKASAGPSWPWVVGFHGYGQSADDMMTELERIPGNEKWTLVSVQALHRFYTRSQKIVASWMTREDRELAIEDNIAYVNQALASVLPASADPSVVFIGFSQGVAMAYRAAVQGTHPARLVIAVGGDVPPELKTEPAARFPSILIAGGTNDEWYTSAKVDADEKALRSIGVKAEVFRYSGGHEFTPELRERISEAIKLSTLA